MPSPVVAPSGAFIEQFAEKEGTLKDAVQIGDKITDLYCRSFNKAELRYGDNFAPIVHALQVIPIIDVLLALPRYIFFLNPRFSLALNVVSRLSALAGLVFMRGLSVLLLDCPLSATLATNP